MSIQSAFHHYKRHELLGRVTDRERLFEVAPNVERELTQTQDGDVYAMGALILSRVFHAQGRVEESAYYLQEASGRVVDETLALWLRIVSLNLEVYWVERASDIAFLEQVEEESADPGVNTLRWMSLAMVRLIDESYEEAVAFLRRALELAQRHNFFRYECLILNQLGYIHLNCAEFEDAAAWFQKTIMMCRTPVIDPVLERGCHLGHVSALLGLRRYAEVRTHVEVHLRGCEGAERYVWWSHHLWAALLECDLGYAREKSLELLEEMGQERSHKHYHGLKTIAECAAILERAPRARATLTELRRVLSSGPWFCQAVVRLLDALESKGPATYVPSWFITRAHWALLLACEASPEAPPMPETFHALEAFVADCLLAQTKPCLYVRGDFSHVSVDAVTWIRLGHRPATQRLLRTLASHAPDTVDTWTLFEATWPQQQVHDAQVVNRLYTTIHRLRQAGLQHVLLRMDEGYRLEGVEFRDVPGL